MRTIFITSLLTLFLSCQSNDTKELKFVCLEASGDTKTYTHTFCGITAKEYTDSYRTGIWKFFVNDSSKIAEGFYTNSLVTIDDQGGCPYFIYMDSTDIEKWSFWDLKGHRISPNQRLKNIITSKDTLWSCLLYTSPSPRD